MPIILDKADRIIAELARKIDSSKTEDDIRWVLKRQTSVLDMFYKELRELRKLRDLQATREEPNESRDEVDV